MLLSVSNLKYPPSPLLSYFSVAVCLRSLLHHILFVTSYDVCYIIYVLVKPGIRFHYYCAVYDECKYSDRFWFAGRTRLFVQYTISLSSLCKLIWRHWTYRTPVRYILSSGINIHQAMYTMITPYASLTSESWVAQRMMTKSNGTIFRVTCPLNSPVTGEMPSKGQWRGVWIFSLICSWISGRVNNRDAGDLRRHGFLYDVIVMASLITLTL